MSDFAVEVLDVADPRAVAGYERAFYASFEGVTGNRLIRRLWRWDDAERRLATRIPYDEQRVLVERDGQGEVEAGMAVNVAMSSFQGAAFGFSPGGDTAGCCELLAFFAATDRRLVRRLRFVAACFEALRADGFRRAYATTAPRPLPSYLQLGGELLDEREVDGEMRYFLGFSLERAWLRAPGGNERPTPPSLPRPRAEDASLPSLPPPSP